MATRNKVQRLLFDVFNPKFVDSNVQFDPAGLEYCADTILEFLAGNEEITTVAELLSCLCEEFDAKVDADERLVWLEHLPGLDWAGISNSENEEPQNDACNSPGADLEKENLEDIKKGILNKFFLSTDSADKTFVPKLVPPPETKSKVRYLDSKVVSTKGERTIVLKPSEEEVAAMKHTYINLKPARKYRFH